MQKTMIELEELGRSHDEAEIEAFYTLEKEA
jgi:hypothetical protein